MPNRLISETSPYLQQHAHNPVDWYPWGAEALEKARAEDKPIFLSIGYAACHWCHVMEHESFEDPETARLLNELFVAIKVDREERPDLDDIYMQAVQALSGRGGWPMSVFLTPDGKPFYGGTYFPPTSQHGMPSFQMVLRSVARAWRERRGELVEQSGQLVERLRPVFEGLSAGPTPAFDPQSLARAAGALARRYDAVHGGFGAAPKFPQPMALEAILRGWRQSRDPRHLEMVTHTLDAMARGGIYDQVGGGFARYSTDPEWLVPHFEKMLYDNALLLRLYTHAWQVTRSPQYAAVVHETAEWVLREMTHPLGGFYSTLDADSDGREGQFYLWSMGEIEQALGHDDARLVNLYYGLYDGPNFEGRNILHVPRDPSEAARAARVDLAALEAALARSKERLRQERAQRSRPARDEKVLAAWNGLMLAGLAEAARVFGVPAWRAAAQRTADFLLARMRRSDGRLWRSWRAESDSAGQAKLEAYLEDYAFLIEGLLALYEVDFDTRWFVSARELAGVVLAHFADGAEWGFFDTADDAETLIVRPKNVQDNAVPSGNASIALGLLKLAAFTGDGRYRDAALPPLSAVGGASLQYPEAFGHWLCAIDFAAAPVHEIAVVGDPAAADTRALLEVAQGPFRPNQVVALSPEAGAPAASIVPLLAGRGRREGRATAYVCREFECRLPVTEAEDLAKLLAAEG